MKGRRKELQDQIIVAVISYVIPAASITMLGWIIKAFRKDRTRQQALEEGLKCLLRDRIIAAHRYHVIEGHEVSHEEYNAMTDMIASYTALKGANGYIERIAKEYTEAPVADALH